MTAQMQQKCPFCDVILTHETNTKTTKAQDRVFIEAKMTPESTAHMWSHAPGDSA